MVAVCVLVGAVLALTGDDDTDTLVAAAPEDAVPGPEDTTTTIDPDVADRLSEWAEKVERAPTLRRQAVLDDVTEWYDLVTNAPLSDFPDSGQRLLAEADSLQKQLDDLDEVPGYVEHAIADGRRIVAQVLSTTTTAAPTTTAKPVTTRVAPATTAKPLAETTVPPDVTDIVEEYIAECHAIIDEAIERVYRDFDGRRAALAQRTQQAIEDSQALHAELTAGYEGDTPELDAQLASAIEDHQALHRIFLADLNSGEAAAVQYHESGRWRCRSSALDY